MNPIHSVAQHDARGLQQALERAHRPGQAYLGDPKVIDQLVRELTSGVFNRYAKVGQGQLRAAQAKQADLVAVEELARILQGAHPGYSAVGNWNPAGLAASARRTLDKRLGQPAMIDNALAIHESVAVLALELYGLLGELGTGGDEAAIKMRVEALVVFYGNLFVGLPQ